MKFSVIVPVFNAEKYLEKCILSVIHQNYDKWELILVDDGSRDNSSNIVDKYAATDDRILAIHQKNSGPGIARNRGIEQATGDYVIFLDSDDYIDEDYFSLLAPKAETADVVFIDVLQVTPNGSLLQKELMSEYKGWSKDKMLRSQMTGKIPWGGVRKAVSRELITTNDIRYTEHKIGEEALFSFRVLYAADKLDFLSEKAVYFYVNHEGSQSKVATEDPWGEVVVTLSDYLKNNGLYDVFANTINAFLMTAVVVALDRIAIRYEYKEFVRKSNIMISALHRNYDKSYKFDYKNMPMKALCVVPFIKAKCLALVYFASKIKTVLNKKRK